MFKHNGIMGNYASQHLFNYFISCVKPAYDYFTRKFDFDLKESVFAFKLPCHILIFELNPAASDVDKSKNLNYNAIIGKLKWSIWLRQKMSQQLPLLQSGRKISPNKLPVWSSACKSILLLQPSSATAERVFSILI